MQSFVIFNSTVLQSQTHSTRLCYQKMFFITFSVYKQHNIEYPTYSLNIEYLYSAVKSYTFITQIFVLKYHLMQFFILFLVMCKSVKHFRKKALLFFHSKHRRSEDQQEKNTIEFQSTLGSNYDKKTAHSVEFNLLYLLMLYDRYFISKRLDNSSQKQGGHTILTATYIQCS